MKTMKFHIFLKLKAFYKILEFRTLPVKKYVCIKLVETVRTLTSITPSSNPLIQTDGINIGILAARVHFFRSGLWHSLVLTAF